MKKNKLIIVLVVLIATTALTFGFTKIGQFLSPSTVVNSPQEEILGIWHLENSPSNTIEFFDNGQVKMFEDNTLLQTDTYSISNICEGQPNDGQMYLRIIDGTDNSVQCNILYGINEDNSGILSFIDFNGHVVIYSR